MILEQGAKFEKVGMTLEDLQSLELRRFRVAEIARLLRVPLHMLYDTQAQPRANMEQASLEFVVSTLRPWLVRFEQTMAQDLLLASERARHFAEHNVAGLPRGDFAARMAGCAQGRQWGWWSVNDIRRLENLNGIGAQGDVYLQPLNMTRAGAPPHEAAPPSPTPPKPRRARSARPAEGERPMTTEFPNGRGYALAAAAEGAAAPTLYLYDALGADAFGGAVAGQVVDDLAAFGPLEAIDVCVNSAGDDVFEGIDVYDALKRFPAKVTVHIIEIAASIASLIAPAGDRTVISENAAVMSASRVPLCSTLDGFPAGAVFLPHPPPISAESVTPSSATARANPSRGQTCSSGRRHAGVARQLPRIRGLLRRVGPLPGRRPDAGHEPARTVRLTSA